MTRFLPLIVLISALCGGGQAHAAIAFDAAQGSTTCGSGTPKLRYLIPGAGTTGSGLAKEWHFGVPFATAITYCITAGIADNDTTVPAASTYVVNFGYK